jgi:hypothetical protein
MGLPQTIVAMTINEKLNSRKILPIVSDPTDEDTDGDELCDNEDEFLLVFNKWFKYNRDDSIDYAVKWAYDVNYEYYCYDKGGDCTNFASQCLYAGGFVMDDIWYSYRGNYKQDYTIYDTIVWTFAIFRNHNTVYKYDYYWNVSDAWGHLPDFENYLETSNLSVEKVTITDVGSISNLIEQYNIQKGDIMLLDKTGSGVPYHATIISSVEGGEIKYAAHTKSRFDENVDAFFKDYKNSCVYVYVMNDGVVTYD